MASPGPNPSRIRPWKLPPPKAYIFTNANIIDTVKGEVQEGLTLTLSNNLIHDITPTASSNPAPSIEGAIVLDLQGKFVCPGLWDCHVHLAATPGEADWRDIRELDALVSAHRQAHSCEQMLHRGFTTVRDTGGASYALKKALTEHVIFGPRLLIAGPFLSQTGGHGDMRSMWDSTEPRCCGVDKALKGTICDGVPECLREARENLRTGSDFLKIMTGGGVASPTDPLHDVQFTAEEITAITTVARNHNTYVTSHAYSPAAIQQAIHNGVTCIEHGNFIDKETAELMVAKNVFLTPTLVCYGEMARKDTGFTMPQESLAKNSEVLKAGLKSLKIAEDAGVAINYGTDLLGHLVDAQSQEFAIRSQVLSAKSILQSATITPARMSGLSQSVGQIKSGFWADLLILNANPLEDITVLSRPEENILTVIKEGYVCMSRWSKLTQEIKPQVQNLE